MVCVSELRGLERFQSRHPEVVVVAVSITNDRTAIGNLFRRQKLEGLRTAVGEDWQGKFGLSEAIPATVLVEAGRIRIVHNAVMPDPVAELEADLGAMRGSTQASGSGKQPWP
jgi:hypothetical protein